MDRAVEMLRLVRIPEPERRIAARFPAHSILRLPALFGPGLKNGVINVCV